MEDQNISAVEIDQQVFCASSQIADEPTFAAPSELSRRDALPEVSAADEHILDRSTHKMSS